MSKPARKSARSIRYRHYGKCSPLDRLPEDVKSELRRRCQSETTFREMQAWLLSEHRCRISQTSLSYWWRRQQMNGWGEAPGQVVTHGQMEIVVTAPGASEVRVQVRTLPFSQPGKA